MTRGEVARRSGLSPSTVRYYEQLGLLPEPRRTSGGYRVYTEADLERLYVIKRAKELGFSLRRVRELLHLTYSHEMCPEHIREHVLYHLQEVRRKIQDLQRIEQTLSALLTDCNRRAPAAECPIVEALRGTRT